MARAVARGHRQSKESVDRSKIIQVARRPGKKNEYREKFEKHRQSLCDFRDAIEDATAAAQYDASKLNSADALVVKLRSDKKEWESVLKIVDN